jgi:chain length determinant protein EpsF
MILRVVRARALLILGIFLVTVLSAGIASFVLPKIYSPSTVLYIDVKALDPVLGGAVNSPQTVRSQLASQVEIIRSDRVVHAVISQIGLDRNPAVIDAWKESTNGQGDIRTWLGTSMLKRLTTKPSNEGTTITITYEDTDPLLATRIANEFAAQYVKATLSLRAEPAVENRGYFEEQVRAHRERVQEARSKMASFRQSRGITSTDERLDIENQRLLELSSQLVAIQGIGADSRSRRDAINRGGSESLPEVVQNTLVQSLKSELGRAEARLQELSARLGENHPQYQSTAGEVQALRARLATEIEKVSRSIVTTSAVNSQREAEIQRAHDAQRAKVLKLKSEREELGALEREVENAQRALDLVNQRLTQTTLESQAPQTKVSVLSPALTPAAPSRPQPVLNLVAGAFVGLLLGMLAALSVEAIRRPVRSADDLIQAVQIPVLAVLPPSSTRHAQRLIGETGPSVASPHLRLGN